MSNRLAHETSPYLQQHASNPVDWYPWGEEALTRAKSEDKPILLSIGYSACHWCHVIAHESFEDPAVAEVMNRHFVNVKVDREERPDLDQIYQTAHQMLSQRTGGWPLTVFLSPDGAPFFAGTYFPKDSRYGLPGFPELCERIAAIWRERRADIGAQNTEVLKAFERTLPRPPAERAQLSLEPVRVMLDTLRASFDARFGGFGGAPKFPHPADLELCLRAGENEIAPLALLADAWMVSGDALYARAAEETAGWIMREMQSPEGGYYSALDADSEHEEGKFYVWSREEVQALLTDEEYLVFSSHYGLDRPPNFENRHWHLYVSRPLEPGKEALLASARRKVFATRERRVRPGRDEKVLASWNALAI